MNTTHRTPLEICKDAMMDTTTTDGPLTDAERRRIIRDLQEIQTAENISDSAMARMIGCSGPLYSQLKHLKYKGDQDRWLLLARGWMVARAERAEVPSADYVNTRIGAMIMAVCRRARTQSTIGRIITPSGAGKTVALMEFARRNAERCVYVYAGECFSTKLSLLQEITRRLGRNFNMRWRANHLYQDLREALAGYYNGGRGIPICILIDEATTLQPKALNMLRNLHDDPACRAAVVLADTWRLDVELHRPSGIAGGYEQLRSRIGADYLLGASDEISAADVRAVADGILAGLGHTRALDGRAYHFLHRLAQRDGKLRNVAKRLHAVWDTAEAVGAKAAYSVAELDYVASLVGCEPEMVHEDLPFKAAPAGRAKRAG